MSSEQLQAFVEAVAANAELQQQVNAATEANAVVDIAKQAGFLISADDLELAKTETDLSDEELEQVTGGVGIITAPINPWQIGTIPLTASNPNNRKDKLKDSSAFDNINVGG